MQVDLYNGRKTVVVVVVDGLFCYSVKFVAVVEMLESHRLWLVIESGHECFLFFLWARCLYDAQSEGPVSYLLRLR